MINGMISHTHINDSQHRHFSFFMCHNSKDKPVVELVAENLLEQHGLHCWVDAWAIAAAADWQKAIDAAMEQCQAAIVFLGENGWGPVHFEEASRFAELQERNQLIVVPACLPGFRETDGAKLQNLFERRHRIKIENKLSELDLEPFVGALNQNTLSSLVGRRWVSPAIIQRDARLWEKNALAKNFRQRLIWYFRGNPYLLAGGKLREALDTSQEYSGLLGKREIAFLEASRERQVRSVRQLAYVLIALLFASIMISSAIFEQRSAALESQSRYLADQARKLQPYDETLSFLLAREGTPRARGPFRRPLVPEIVAPLRSYLGKAGSIAFKTEGHAGEITDASFSYDSHFAVSSGKDETIRVWDVLTGAEIQSLDVDGVPETVGFSPDGDHVFATFDFNDFSADADVNEPEVSGRVQIWKTETGEESFSQYFDFPEIEFSSDARLFFVTALDRLFVFKSDSFHPVFETHERSIISAAAFSPDSRQIFWGSNNGGLNLIDSADGTLIHHLETPSFRVQSVDFSKDGTLLSATLEDGSLHVWDSRTGAEISNLTVETNPIQRAHFIGNDKMLIISAGAGTHSNVEYWNLEPLERIRSVGKINSYSKLQALSDHSVLVLGRDTDHMLLSNLSDPDNNISIGAKGESVGVVRLAPNGRYIITVSLLGNALRIWDAQSGSQTTTLGWGNITACESSPDGRYLSIATTSGVTKILDRASMKPFINLHGSVVPVTATAFSPSSKLFALGRSDGSIKVFSLPSFDELVTLQGHSETITSLNFSDKDEKLVSSSTDDTARVWDLQSRSAIELIGHGDDIEKAHFLGSPSILLTEGYGTSPIVRVWDIRSDVVAERYSIKNARSAFPAHDGKHIVVTAFSNDQAKIIRAADGTVLAASDFVDSSVDLQFSTDGSMVVGKNVDDTISVWDAMSLTLLATYDDTEDYYGPRFDSDSSHIASFSYDENNNFNVSILDAVSETEIATFDLSLDVWTDDFLESPLERVWFSADEKMLYTCNGFGVRAWPLLYDPFLASRTAWDANKNGGVRHLSDQERELYYLEN